MRLKIGVHVSISGSIDKAVERAKEKECTTFQIFTRNPRGWAFKELEEEKVDRFKRNCGEMGYDVVLAHMPYLPNLACPKEEIYGKSVESLTQDLVRCGRLKIPYLVIHLGSHLGAGMKEGFRRIIDGCNKALASADSKVMLLLENTAGQRNSMGSSFEDIKFIIDRLNYPSRVGVCFDTCHAFAAGYDLRTAEAVDGTLRKFDAVVGFKTLKAVHLNDSKGGLASGLDRHEHIGMGEIGKRGFREILHRREIRELPMVLETPVDKRCDDLGNLGMTRELAA